MLFDLNGQEFQVKFSRTGTTTHAELLAFDDNGKFSYTGISGISYCNPKDRFEKSKGRKIALAKLLNAMVEYEPQLGVLNLGKKQRAKIWEIYFKEHKK
jgi:hypothetical protein